MIKNPTISLICATIGRFEAIKPLLNSLKEQNFKDFELIIVDQNDDKALLEILTPYFESFTTHYFKTEAKGAASSRNFGISKAKGALIAFPDDDCYYNSDTLEKVNAFFSENKDYTAISIQYFDIGSSKSMQGAQPSQNITLKNVLPLTAMISIFALTEKVREVGGFDENLDYGNPNALAQAFEDFELVMNLINHNFKVKYLNDISVFHKIPEPIGLKKLSDRTKKRIVEGGAAQIYVAKKHYSWLKIIKLFALHLCAIPYNILKLNKVKITFHLLMLKGMFRIILK